MPEGDLAKRSCVPCRGGVPPLGPSQIEPLLAKLDPGWEAVEDHHLMRAFTFRNFKEALAFTNRVGEIAEKEDHHPDIHLGYGLVTVEIWTHKIDGLTESDFVLAAKVDEAYAKGR